MRVIHDYSETINGAEQLGIFVECCARLSSALCKLATNAADFNGASSFFRNVSTEPDGCYKASCANSPKCTRQKGGDPDVLRHAAGHAVRAMNLHIALHEWALSALPAAWTLLDSRTHYQKAVNFFCSACSNHFLSFVGPSFWGSIICATRCTGVCDAGEALFGEGTLSEGMKKDKSIQTSLSCRFCGASTGVFPTCASAAAGEWGGADPPAAAFLASAATALKQLHAVKLLLSFICCFWSQNLSPVDQEPKNGENIECVKSKSCGSGYVIEDEIEDMRYYLRAKASIEESFCYAIYQTKPTVIQQIICSFMRKQLQKLAEGASEASVSQGCGLLAFLLERDMCRSISSKSYNLQVNALSTNASALRKGDGDESSRNFTAHFSKHECDGKSCGPSLKGGEVHQEVQNITTRLRQAFVAACLSAGQKWYKSTTVDRDLSKHTDNGLYAALPISGNHSFRRQTCSCRLCKNSKRKIKIAGEVEQAESIENIGIEDVKLNFGKYCGKAAGRIIIALARGVSGPFRNNSSCECGNSICLNNYDKTSEVSTGVNSCLTNSQRKIQTSAKELGNSCKCVFNRRRKEFDIVKSANNDMYCESPIKITKVNSGFSKLSSSDILLGAKGGVPRCKGSSSGCDSPSFPVLRVRSETIRTLLVHEDIVRKPPYSLDYVSKTKAGCITGDETNQQQIGCQQDNKYSINLTQIAQNKIGSVCVPGCLSALALLGSVIKVLGLQRMWRELALSVVIECFEIALEEECGDASVSHALIGAIAVVVIPFIRLAWGIEDGNLVLATRPWKRPDSSIESYNIGPANYSGSRPIRKCSSASAKKKNISSGKEQVGKQNITRTPTSGSQLASSSNIITDFEWEETCGIGDAFFVYYESFDITKNVGEYNEGNILQSHGNVSSPTLAGAIQSIFCQLIRRLQIIRLDQLHENLLKKPVSKGALGDARTCDRLLNCVSLEECSDWPFGLNPCSNIQSKSVGMTDINLQSISHKHAMQEFWWRLQSEIQGISNQKLSAMNGIKVGVGVLQLLVGLGVPQHSIYKVLEPLVYYLRTRKDVGANLFKLLPRVWRFCKLLKRVQEWQLSGMYSVCWCLDIKASDYVDYLDAEEEMCAGALCAEGILKFLTDIMGGPMQIALAFERHLADTLLDPGFSYRVAQAEKSKLAKKHETNNAHRYGRLYERNSKNISRDKKINIKHTHVANDACFTPVKRRGPTIYSDIHRDEDGYGCHEYLSKYKNISKNLSSLDHCWCCDDSSSSTDESSNFNIHNTNEEVDINVDGLEEMNIMHGSECMNGLKGKLLPSLLRTAQESVFFLLPRLHGTRVSRCLSMIEDACDTLLTMKRLQSEVSRCKTTKTDSHIDTAATSNAAFTAEITNFAAAAAVTISDSFDDWKNSSAPASPLRREDCGRIICPPGTPPLQRSRFNDSDVYPYLCANLGCSNDSATPSPFRSSPWSIHLPSQVGMVASDSVGLAFVQSNIQPADSEFQNDPGTTPYRKKRPPRRTSEAPRLCESSNTVTSCGISLHEAQTVLHPLPELTMAVATRGCWPEEVLPFDYDEDNKIQCIPLVLHIATKKCCEAYKCNRGSAWYFEPRYEQSKMYIKLDGNRGRWVSIHQATILLLLDNHQFVHKTTHPEQIKLGSQDVSDKPLYILVNPVNRGIDGISISDKLNDYRIQMTASEISKRLGMSKDLVAKNLDRLKQMNWIEENRKSTGISVSEYNKGGEINSEGDENICNEAVYSLCCVNTISGGNSAPRYSEKGKFYQANEFSGMFDKNNLLSQYTYASNEEFCPIFERRKKRHLNCNAGGLSRKSRFSVNSFCLNSWETNLNESFCLYNRDSTVSNGEVSCGAGVDTPFAFGSDLFLSTLQPEIQRKSVDYIYGKEVCGGNNKINNKHENDMCDNEEVEAVMLDVIKERAMKIKDVLAKSTPTTLIWMKLQQWQKQQESNDSPNGNKQKVWTLQDVQKLLTQMQNRGLVKRTCGNWEIA